MKLFAISLLFVLLPTTVLGTPETPTGLQVKQERNYKIALKWYKTPGAKLYVIHRNGRVLMSVYGVDNVKDDKAITPLSTYRYTVSACESRGDCSKPSSGKFVIYTADDGKLTTPPVTFEPKAPTDFYISTSAGAQFLRWTPHGKSEHTMIYHNDQHINTVKSTNHIHQILNAKPGDMFHLISVFRDGTRSQRTQKIELGR